MVALALMVSIRTRVNVERSMLARTVKTVSTGDRNNESYRDVDNEIHVCHYKNMMMLIRTSVACEFGNLGPVVQKPVSLPLG